MSTKNPNKELCEWSLVELRDHFAKLGKVVAKPKYACTHCGRAARAKKWLCQPKKLAKN